MANTDIQVPDLGGYQDIPVIELLVKPGQVIQKDQGLVVLESDKATMEVPSTVAGTLVALRVKVGDRVRAGTVVAVIDSGPAQTAAAAVPTQAQRAAQAATAPPTSGKHADFDCQVAVLGSGPGGYTAAFRAADLGLNVVLIERYPDLGGVCLNVGCIPSKALLHVANVLEEARHATAMGVHFAAPRIDVEALRGYKNKVVKQLTQGLSGMAKQRQVTRVTGKAQFTGTHEIAVETESGTKTVRFEHAIIAAGSQSVRLPGLPWDDPRLVDSTGALQLESVPEQLLVIGGGIIGLEMASVYAALGSKVTVVELSGQLIPGADPDLVKPLEARLKKRCAGIHLNTRVARLDAKKDGLWAHYEGASAAAPQRFDRVLCAVGRSPNGHAIQAQVAGVPVDARGFIAVDRQMRTAVPHIFAIGDIVGQPMLAHKAAHEGKVAAEVCAGHKTEFVARVIPSVAYTDPEIAWVGVTETEAKAKAIAYGVGKFPHAASGRAIGIDRTEGMTKLLFDEKTRRVIGGGVVGPHAGDLVAEIALAIEMGCEAHDLGLTVHPHPTLSESIGMAAEVFEGTVTDLYLPKRK